MGTIKRFNVEGAARRSTRILKRLGYDYLWGWETGIGFVFGSLCNVGRSNIKHFLQYLTAEHLSKRSRFKSENWS